MKSLVAGLVALCFVGPANATVFTYRASNGHTFSVTVDDIQVTGAQANCEIECGAVGGSYKIYTSFGPLQGDGVSYGVTYNYFNFGFFAYTGAGIDVTPYIGGIVFYEFVVDFGDRNWRTKTLLELLSHGGTYVRHGFLPRYQNTPEFEEACYQDVVDCGLDEVLMAFQITSIDGVPTPIPAAGLFLLTGLLGLTGIRGARTSQ